MAKEVSYGICPYKILYNEFYILLNKTSKNSLYNFFKGKQEGTESIKQCAIREFEEEAGVSVPKDLLEDFFFQKSPKKNIGIFLLDWANFDDNFKFDKREIWSASWVKVDGFNSEVSKNQAKIMNDIILFFKPRRFHLNSIITN